MTVNSYDQDRESKQPSCRALTDSLSRRTFYELEHMEVAVPTKTRNLFISHAWRYSERYEGVVGLLNRAPNFHWHNHSVPKYDPAIDPNSEFGRNRLIQALRNQIRGTHCVIVVAGMYVNARYWIQKEIEIANEWNKPIVAIRRRGQQRTPQELVNMADRTVNWNSNSLVTAIREIC